MSANRIPNPTGIPVRYGAALLFTFAGLMFTLAVRPIVKLDAFILMQGAVFMSAWFGGLGPGLLSSLLSMIAIDYYFTQPLYHFSFSWTHGKVDIILFGIITLVTSSLNARLRHAKLELEQAHDELEDRIRERTEELSATNDRLKAEVATRLAAEKALSEISNREQQRMGQDLHDGLCQTLAGVRLITETLHDRLEELRLPEKAYVEKIESRLSEALAQADSVSRGLYPVELETDGLVAALRELADNVSTIYGVTVRFVCRNALSLGSGAMATHVFRIAQEATVNAIKSGKAQTIDIRLFRRHRYVVLAVRDDGSGVDPDHQRKGMGLTLIGHRARLLDATFQLRNRARRGAIAVCYIPARALD